MNRLVLAAVAASLCAACSSTIRVKETSTGGDITLVGARGETMDLAKPVMAAKCGGPQGYDVVEDTGPEAHPDEQGEWRLTYRCRSGQQEAKPAAPPPQS